jgi:hypothetical protein
MKITGANGQAVAQTLFSSSATQYHEYGFCAVAEDRVFRYVRNGAVALVVGNCLQSAAQNTGHAQLTCRATAIGGFQVLFTTGATLLAENDYADGYAVIDTTPGLGYAYHIKSHAAIAATTDGAMNLVDGESIQVALTSASRVTLIANPCKNVIQHPVTTATSSALGGCIYPLAINEFGWVQTGGLGVGLIAGTPAVGQPVTSVGAVAGALTVHTAELNAVATMQVTGVDTKVMPVKWLLD